MVEKEFVVLLVLGLCKSVYKFVGVGSFRFIISCKSINGVYVSCGSINYIVLVGCDFEDLMIDVVMKLFLVVRNGIFFVE